MEAFTFEQLPQAVTVLTQEVQELKEIILQNTKQPEQPETPIYLEEAAELLGIEKPTLYSKVSRREVPFHKRGNRLYFFKSELLDYIKEGRKKTTAEIEAEAETYLRKSHKKKC